MRTSTRIHPSLCLVAAAAMGAAGLLSPGCGSDDTTQTGDESNLIEGLDDPFVRLALGGCTVVDEISGKSAKPEGGGECPTTIEALLAKLEANAKQAPKVFVVSERGDQPGPSTPYRFVIAQGAEGSGPEELFISALGSGKAVSQGFIEVMAFSKSKQAYNFYHLVKGKWQLAGDGTMVKPGEPAAFECARCHTSGGPLMKELQDSWNNWHSIWFSMPDPKSSDETFNRLFGKKRGAEDLEDILFVGIKAHIEGRIERTLREKGGLKALLRQVMCEVAEANFVSSHNRNSQRFGTVEVSKLMNFPPSILVSQALKPGFKQDGYDNLIGMDLPAMNNLEIDGGSYSKAVAAIGQKIGGEAGDTIFGLFFPDRGYADNMVVESLIRRKILDKDLAADLLTIDFTVPSYSKIRCDLASTAPDEGSSPEEIRKAWAENLEGSDLPGAAVLLGFLKDTNDFDAHQKAVNDYLTACVERSKADPDGYALDIVKIGSQRRKEFLEQYGALVESKDLLPTDDLTETAPHSLRLSPTTCKLEPQTGEISGTSGSGAGGGGAGGGGEGGGGTGGDGSGGAGSGSGAGQGGGSSGSCAHDECEVGVALDASCSECAKKVCDADSFCCASSWDEACVSGAKNLCGCN